MKPQYYIGRSSRVIFESRMSFPVCLVEVTWVFPQSIRDRPLFKLFFCRDHQIMSMGLDHCQNYNWWGLVELKLV
jgi:hypothetical protein